MGNSQSRQTYETVVRDTALLERLRSLQLDLDKKDSAGDDYIHVDSNEKKWDAATPSSRSRSPEGLTVSDVEEWQTSLLKDPKNRLAIQAFTKASPRDVLASQQTKLRDAHVFNIQIPLEGGPVTNQRSSGRCWLFASTNVFRVALMRRHNLAAFELSQAYLFFWDKLEKSNWFLEQVLDTAGAAEPLDGRLAQTLLREPLSDGGQWDMVYNLVDKYGLVPQALYPDSWNAMNSGTLNSVVLTKLRQDALVLRRLVEDGAAAGVVRRRKTQMVKEIHTVLTLTLGPPPAADGEFVWDFVDKDGKARSVRATPKSFARDIESSAGRGGLFAGPKVEITREGISKMLSLVHDPRHEPLTHLSVDRLGNIVGGRGVRYVNVEMATLKAACVAQLEAGIPVFFGCDVGKFSDSNAGIMDLDLFDYEVGFGISLLETGPEKKAERLRSGDSQMTHAMVLTAVHVDEQGKTIRWRVQNSWGETRGEKGWFVMSDAWMDEFVYQAVIDPRFVDSKVTDVLDKEPIVLPLWDPMGSLA